ncbi:MAG: prepilin-type N-terminal cleavage/methylation domain-containing protein [Candidatus Saccharimonadales bacterium]
MQSSSTRIQSAGFTVSEMLIVVVITGILGVLVFDTLNGLYSSTVNSLGKTAQDTDTRGALRKIQDDLKNNVGFQASVNTQVPVGYNNGSSWSYLDGGNANKRVFIAQSYATNAALTSTSRLPVFKSNSGNCDSPTDPATVTQVYFVAKDPASPAPPNDQYNLYRRTILASTNPADYCGSLWQKQSCTAGVTSSNCMMTDTLLLRNITKFSVDYYSSSSPTSANLIVSSNDATDQSILVNNNARMAKITIETKRSIQGKITSTVATAQVNEGVLTSFTGGSNGGADYGGIDTTTGSTCIDSEHYTTPTYVYSIPSCATYIDIVALSGGGGGQGGALNRSSGHGGQGGAWRYITLRRGVDIDANVIQITGSVGGGGVGGAGQFSGLSTIFGPADGAKGSDTTAFQTTPADGDGPLALQINWPGLTAIGGGGGHSRADNEGIDGSPSIPQELGYLGATYTAGNPGTGTNDNSGSGNGLAPGGAGSGGLGNTFSALKGGNGAAGSIWFRSY